MAQVPIEIQKSILIYCDDKTKRIARVSCKQWFNFIDYRNFTFYLTKKSDWPQIVDRLSSYSKPISLSLVKNIMHTMCEINEHLVRLTSLTDLTIEYLDLTEKNLEAEWLKLTALPNIRSIKVMHELYTIPPEAMYSFPNLTKFSQPWQFEGDNLLLQKSIRRWTNLQSLSILQSNSVDFDLFDNYNTTLTSLNLHLPTVPKKLFDQLGNLKYLSIYISQPDELSLKSLTSLEHLIMNSEIHELNSTKLTYLELFEMKEKSIEQQVDKLTNLKELVFDFQMDEIESDPPRQFSYKWLTALTALESISVDHIQGNGLAYISTTLTRLQINVRTQADLGHVSRFVSLKQLILQSANEKQQDLSLLSILTHLECLQLHIENDNSEINFLSSMTNLTWLALARCSPGQTSYLPNLASLVITSTTGCKFAGFEGLPKLTELKVSHNFGIDSDADFDYSFVSNLTTLKHLFLTPRHKKYDCRYFSTLTDLQSLRFEQVTSDDDYCHLSTLTNLTQLIITSGPPSLKMLHLPTSLQHIQVDFTEHEEVDSDDMDFNSVIEPLLQKLPNVYKYKFE